VTVINELQSTRRAAEQRGLLGQRRPDGSGERSPEVPWLLCLARQYSTSLSPVRLASAPGGDRSYALLEHNDVFEAWVIKWPTGGHLDLHDHGLSAGAFWVIDGYLEECALTANGTMTVRRVGANRGRAFSEGVVHDVINPGSRPATSVHVYSPPLSTMTFFRWDPDGLVPERTEHRSDSTWLS
jgi:hypothetical protein